MVLVVVTSFPYFWSPVLDVVLPDNDVVVDGNSAFIGA